MKAILLSLSLALGGSGYVCPPCYHVDNLFETEVYEHDGQCPVCGMRLIERRTLSDMDKVAIHEGSGNFLLKEGLAHPDKPIFVFYHKPAGFNADSPILLVISGAGRNAWDYRDDWVDVAEARNVLVLAPSYDDDQYDFAAYHLGGVVKNLKIENINEDVPDPAPNRYHVKDEDIHFDINPDPDTWIFADFDLIFERAVATTGSRQKSYDVFGHSAGGQILHRMALFRPKSLANRIVAANSGFYTLPDETLSLPFGLKGSVIASDTLADTFSSQLVLLLGEDDNENETRGSMLHTPTVDRQGLGRYARGQSFFRESQQLAKRRGMAFNWRLVSVEGVGHDYEKMGKAAARLLYEYLE